MKIKKVEHVIIDMTSEEAEQLILLLEQIDGGMSNLPDWAKAQSIEYVRKIKQATGSPA